MGGCCCCSSKGTELNNTPAYYYYPRASEEHVPLSSHHAAASLGLLVDTNLETSVPDTYRPPPTPMPYDVALGHPQTPPAAQDIFADKNEAALQTPYSYSDQETIGGKTCEIPAKCEDVKEPDCKAHTDLEPASMKEAEVELSNAAKPIVSATEEEDVCPTCLEEYNAENPKITTKCEHHFHLACILEWKERSDTCPVCDQEMIIHSPIDL